MVTEVALDLSWPAVGESGQEDQHDHNQRGRHDPLSTDDLQHGFGTDYHVVPQGVANGHEPVVSQGGEVEWLHAEKQEHKEKTG